MGMSIVLCWAFWNIYQLCFTVYHKHVQIEIYCKAAMQDLWHIIWEICKCLHIPIHSLNIQAVRCIFMCILNSNLIYIHKNLQNMVCNHACVTFGYTLKWIGALTTIICYTRLNCWYAWEPQSWCLLPAIVSVAHWEYICPFKNWYNSVGANFSFQRWLVFHFRIQESNTKYLGRLR